MKDDNNGWVSWAASTVAFGGAAHVAGFSSAFNQANHPAISPTITPKQSAAQRAIRDVTSSRDLISGNLKKKAALARLDKIENALQAFPSIPGMNKAISREWEAAKKSVLPSRMSTGFNIGGSAPLQDIRGRLQESNNVYMQDVFRRFASNVESLSRTGQFDTLQDLTRTLSIPEHLRNEGRGFSNKFVTGVASELTGVLGDNVTARFRGVEGAGEFIFSAGDDLFTLPQSFGPQGLQKGLIRTGQGLHNIYAPGLFSLVDESGNLGKSMTFTEFSSAELVKTAREAMSSGVSVEAALAERSKELGKFMDFMEPSLGDESFSLETIAKSQRLTIVNEAGKRVTGDIAQKVLEKHGDKLTPTSKAGRFQMLAPSQIYAGFTNLLDYSRKPWQSIRQLNPTAEAQSAIRNGDFRDFQFLDSPAAIKQFKGPSGARLKTLYLSDSQLAELESLGFPVGDGELLVNEKFKNQFEVTRTRRVAVHELNTQVGAQLRGLRKGNIDVLLASASATADDVLLGRSVSGELLTARKGTRIKGFSEVPIKGTGTAGYNLVLEETIQMGKYEKVFGGLKGMAKFGSFNSRPLAQALGMAPHELETYGALGRFSDIKAAKDPALRAMQQFSGIMLHAKSLNSPDAQTMLRNSSRFMSEINLAGSPEQMNKELRAMAGLIGITEGSEDFSRIFGDAGNVEGVTRLKFGGTKEFTGAGKLGTIEPRILNLLESQGGAFGNEMGSELVGRVMAADPDRLAIHNELRKTFESMVEGANVPTGQNISMLDKPELQELRRTGGYIETHIPDMPSIYMPGYKDIPALAPYKVGEDMVTTAPLQKTFRDIERTITSRTLGPAEKMAQFESKFFPELVQAYAPAGKGQGALARGQVFGSRFLTAVSGEGAFYDSLKSMGLQESAVMGVPEKYGVEMIEELAAHGQDVEGMLERFRAGKPVGAAVARHPFIGAHSMQPVQMIMSKETEPVIYMPEKTLKVNLPGVAEPQPIMQGIATGMGADKDADIIMAVAVNKDMEQKVRSQLAGANAQLEAYSQHSIRTQLLKGEKGGDALGVLSRRQQIAAAGTKLGIVDEYVGQVSNSLAQARAAVGASDMNSIAQSRALGLLEWLEQQPISAKHLSESQITSGVFGDQMKSIMAGVQGDSDLLVDTVQDMTKGARNKTIRDGILGSGFDLDSPFEMHGQQIKSIKGFDLKNTAVAIAEAVKGFKTSKMDGITLAQAQRYMKPGRSTTASRRNFPDMLRATSATGDKVRSAFSEYQKRTLSSINKASAQVTARIKPLAKPIMAGLAAAGFASFALSGSPGELAAPVDRVGSMPEHQAVIGRSNRDNVSIPELDQQALGNPSASGMRSNRQIVLDEAQSDRSRDMRMRINAQNLNATQRRELSSRLNSRFPGGLDLNIRDSRRSLSQHTLSDMID